MKIIEKDILTVEKGIICQQVNCQGKMNSGLAKQIREKWTVVYDEYIKLFKNKQDFQLLGERLYVNVKPNLWVCNIFGQLNYGYDKNRYTDYGALRQAFENMEYISDLQFYFPYNFGCDRGGGDWKIISKMIEFYFPDAIICKLPGGT